MTRKASPASDRSVHIGRDAKGSIIQTGDLNVASVDYRQISLPPPESVDIRETISTISATLTQLGATDQRKIENALSDAEDELNKPEPDKDEVGSALDRALKYAEKAEGFTGVIEKLTPCVINAASWLGMTWHSILSFVGLAT
jgi:hypothetical protein